MLSVSVASMLPIISFAVLGAGSAVVLTSILFSKGNTRLLLWILAALAVAKVAFFRS